MRNPIFLAPLVLLTASCFSAQTPAFRPQTIDAAIKIGYGLAIADVQGDGKPDILLADKTQIVWYQNPTWEKHIVAENLTPKDNVCIAARDIDGDGKCEIAVGAEWNPSDTVNSGAVFYLIPPADRTQKWEPVRLHHEPTVHRMKWVQRGKDRFDLVVVPLHGRDNKNGEGETVKVLAYQKPINPKDEWKTEIINDQMHLTHNFDLQTTGDDTEGFILGGKEGWSINVEDSGKYRAVHGVRYSDNPDLKGVGEIRLGHLSGMPFLASIEPMHGNQLVLHRGAQMYLNQSDKVYTFTARSAILDETLADGHALACADLLGLGSDQIVVGWRAMSNRLTKVGIKLFVPKDKSGTEWQPHLIDDNTMACEDLVVADLNTDGKPDIIASGRRTQNVIIYWNESNAPTPE